MRNIGMGDNGPQLISTKNRFIAEIQIKLTFLQILVENHPEPCDFDAARERIALPNSPEWWNVYGQCVRGLQIAKFIVEVGITRSMRPEAKGGKRSLWSLVSFEHAKEWIEAYRNILPIDPQGRLFEPEEEAGK